jgi:hypothetical protein
MAEYRDGSASTASTVPGDALIVVVALTVSSVMVAGPHPGLPGRLKAGRRAADTLLSRVLPTASARQGCAPHLSDLGAVP